MKNKRILFILPWLALGGMERMQVILANALSRRGYSVTVMILSSENTLRGELDSDVEFIYKPPKQHLGNRIPYIRHKYYDDGMWETRATPEQLYKYYVGNRVFDVEIGFFRGMSVKIVSGSTNPTSIKLAWVHSDFKKCGGFDYNFRSFEDVKLAYSRFDRIVCVSQQVEKSFREVIGLSPKTTTIYNMIPVKEVIKKANEKVFLEKRTITAIAAGHIIPIKGYDRLIKAAERLIKSGYCFDLWILGEGIDRDKLQKYIDDNQLYSIKLFGQKKNPYPYIKCADFLICASYYEGFPLNVCEAVVLGTPVLSTNCTGSNEILGFGKYGMIVDNSEEGLFGGLRQLIENPGLIEEYRKRVLQRQSFFNEERIMNQIESLFEK